MNLPYAEVVLVHRRGERDDFGQVGPTTTHSIGSVAFAPRRTTETNTATRNTVVYGLTAYMPFNANIRSSDVVERRDGSKWQVVGEPMRWRSPMTGWQPGCEVDLERATG